LRDALDRSRGHYQRIYEESRDVMRLLASMKIPAPDSLRHAAEYVLTLKLEEMVGDLSASDNRDLDLGEAVASLVREAAMTGSRVDFSALKNAVESTVHSRLESYPDSDDEANAESALKFLTLADELGLKLDLWRLQNQFWNLLNHSRTNDVDSNGLIAKLGDKLKFSSRMVQMKLGTGH